MKNPLLEQVEEGRSHPAESNVTSNHPESTGRWTLTNNKEQSLAWAVNASWVVNWFLLLGKAVVVVLSNSKAMTAALVDSAVDLLTQFILSTAEKYMSKRSDKYPVGRSRLEALSVIACAFIMTMASIEGTVGS
ncbi:hypothetical protein EON65_53840 [archaeon]|nr:MAG: hypothetical protein EON65_53840 [archaeon]